MALAGPSAGVAWAVAAVPVTATCLVGVLLAAHASEHPTVLGRWSTNYALGLLAYIAVILVLDGLAIRFRHRLAAWLRGNGARLAALGFGIVVAIVGAEVVVRQANLLGVGAITENERYFARATRPSPTRQWEHVPGHVGTYNGVRVVINALGLRDREAMSGGDPLRILALGDSVTFGWGVEEQDLWVRRVERRLNEAGAGGGRRVEVLNLGVCGYNTSQELALLREVGPRLRAQMVVLLYVDNDVESRACVPPRGWSVETVPTYLVYRAAQVSWLVRLVKNQTERLLGMRGWTEIALAQGCGWEESARALRHLVAWARQHEARLLILHYNGLEVPPGVHRQIGTLLDTLGAEEGVPVVELPPLAADREWRRFRNSPLDPHPNVAGHALLARQIYPILARALGLGPGRRPRSTGQRTAPEVRARISPPG